MSIQCPVCDRGTLHDAVVQESIRYAGDVLLVDGIEVSRCDRCGEEVVLPDQAKRNERRFVDAKRGHDGLLTSDEIARWLESLRITQTDAAKILGGGPNALAKYIRGEVVQSRAMDNLLRVSLEYPQVRQSLFARAGIAYPHNGWMTLVHCDDAPVAVREGAATVVGATVVVDREGWATERLSESCG
jgi:HTH-type transcriptional regulator/antitoxin MqsA